jgi:hypothetical protein
MYSKLELALKEFVLRYQHQTILSDAILIEKAKLLASELEVPEGMLQFSSGWLQGFKKRNGIHQKKLHREAEFSDQTAIDEILPLLCSKYASYLLKRIYNIDETGLFYQYVFMFCLKLRNTVFTLLFFRKLEPDRTLATKCMSGRKKNKERLSIALCANADGSHKLNPLIIGKFAKPRCFKNVNINNLPMMY